jgi:hypothetical protein
MCMVGYLKRKQLLSRGNWKLLILLLLTAVYADYRGSIFDNNDKTGSIDNEERRNVEISVVKSRIGGFSPSIIYLVIVICVINFVNESCSKGSLGRTCR